MRQIGNRAIATKAVHMLSLTGTLGYEMDPTLSSRPLEHPLYLKPGFPRDVLRTVGEAAMFIKQLPAKYDGVLHWSLAGATVEDAARRSDSADALHIATMAMELALETEDMLRSE